MIAGSNLCDLDFCATFTTRLTRLTRLIFARFARLLLTRLLLTRLLLTRLMLARLRLTRLVVAGMLAIARRSIPVMVTVGVPVAIATIPVAILLVVTTLILALRTELLLPLGLFALRLTQKTGVVLCMLKKALLGDPIVRQLSVAGQG
ncbi:hypothetical protein [Paracoccus sp. (in: a-proteobacteria)]|uniref:hypothetical protein n=1 Tax=Paracoccus sp. TaxID=267 RepID=UPI00289EBC07|nr:hypothetical protein [Paracoccus sp. (in: a-proteobacteria)]